MRQRNLWIVMAMALLGAALPTPRNTPASAIPSAATNRGEAAPNVLTVMTYNVKGLPWPVARGRTDALTAIGARLAGLRAQGRHPHVIALQEAFTEDARAIGRAAGYAHIADGPTAQTPQPPSSSPDDRAFASRAQWLKGETQGKFLGSGLQVLSDYPIVRVRRAAFPQYACAGYDCLANKGVLLVAIRVPGSRDPVEIVTTHFNSRRSTGVSRTRSLYAYRRQAEFLRTFLAANHESRSPLILAGDFNTGTGAGRKTAFFSGLRRWSERDAHVTLRDGLLAGLSLTPTQHGRSSEAQWIIDRASDGQLMTDGASTQIAATRIEVPFGREHNRTMLSDHMGFTVEYRLNPLPASERQ